MTLLPLLNRSGRVVGHAVIDPTDADLLGRHTWRLHPDGYAARYERRDGHFRAIMLHREVLADVPSGLHVDHINRDRLDNRKANLRPCTLAENRQNRGSVPGTSSHYRGVFRAVTRTGQERWRAHARLNGRRVHLGTFDTESEAAVAASDFRREHMPFSSDAAKVKRILATAEVDEHARPVVAEVAA